MTLQFCNPINIPLKRKCVAVDYRGGIEVDEVDEVDEVVEVDVVDGRSPVERAAATFFVPSYEHTLPGRLLNALFHCSSDPTLTVVPVHFVETLKEETVCFTMITVL